ncbi:hypothetical protein [Desulfosporosinus acidiphilus]|uniref:hypothetical protein n=1 Tax=Desulfosporosinus acidiphilus TaxID=885581 RepID=UPI00059D0DF5|nr:hypothetical protein [Desulfosporosinus acidiphilus]
MKVCYIYYFIEPIKEQYHDDGSTAFLEIDIPGTEYHYKASLLGTEDVPNMLRISISYVNEDKIPEISLNAIQSIKEHMFSTLRISYDPSLQFSKISLWNFIDKGNPPGLSVKLQEKYNSVPVNREIIKNNFTSTWENRYLIKLLTDGLNEDLPLYYRYLSFYRILEDSYKNNGKWDSEYDILLNKFNDQYISKEYSKLSISGYIETLRNRCAHGRFIFKKTDERGITQLDNKGLLELQEFMPLMIEIVVTSINSNKDTVGKFIVGLNRK